MDKRTDRETDRIATSISWVSMLRRDKNESFRTVSVTNTTRLRCSVLCVHQDRQTGGGIMFIRTFGLSPNFSTNFLTTNEPILMPIGTSGLWVNGMKRSTVKIKRSEVKITRGRRYSCRPGGGISFSTPLGRVCDCNVVYLLTVVVAETRIEMF